MKKLILATFLTLLSFNANARCFDDKASDGIILECNIEEAEKNIKTNPFFYFFHLGTMNGISLTLLSEAKYSYPELSPKQIRSCIALNIETVHNHILDKVKNKTVQNSDHYTLVFTNTYFELYENCIKNIQQKQQDSLDL